MSQTPFSSDLLYTALDISPQALVITDADPAPAGGRIIYVNRAFERLIGWSAEAAIGQSVRILEGPDS